MKSDFTGKGISFPLKGNFRGGISVSWDIQKIRESILMILGTQHGERVMRPYFGCNLKCLVFSPNNNATANLASHYVKDGLTKWEPRISVTNITVDNNTYKDRLIIHIQYKIKSTGESQNLVYPFYLDKK